MDQSSPPVIPRKRITHRATLAPGKSFGQWTVGDFRRFVEDCEAQGIGDETLLRPNPDKHVFARDRCESGSLIAERHVSVD